jgi:hypothetical protein
MRTLVVASLLCQVISGVNGSYTSVVHDRMMTLSEEGRLSPSARAELKQSLNEERDAAKLDFAEKGLYFIEPKETIVVDLGSLVTADPLSQRNQIEIVVVTGDVPETTSSPVGSTAKAAGYFGYLYRSFTDLFRD